MGALINGNRPAVVAEAGKGGRKTMGARGGNSNRQAKVAGAGNGGRLAVVAEMVMVASH